MTLARAISGLAVITSTVYGSALIGRMLVGWLDAEGVPFPLIVTSALGWAILVVDGAYWILVVRVRSSRS